MAKKRTRARQQKRVQMRAAQKDVRQREKLVRASEGGSPGRAFEVSTPAVIGPMLRSMRCHQCDGELEPTDATAKSTPLGLRRVAETRCRRCHTPRAIWFAIGPTIN